MYVCRLPAHASLNYVKTGTCVDYSVAATTLLRKAGYYKNEVYTVLVQIEYYISKVNPLVGNSDLKIIFINGNHQPAYIVPYLTLISYRNWIADYDSLTPRENLKRVATDSHSFNLVKFPSSGEKYRVIDVNANKRDFIVPVGSLSQDPTLPQWQAILTTKIGKIPYCNFVDIRPKDVNSPAYGFINDEGAKPTSSLRGAIDGCL